MNRADRLRYWMLPAAAICMFAGPVQAAQNDTVQFGPAPAWVRQVAPAPAPDNATGIVFVERRDDLIHLDSKGSSQFIGYRIKLLHPNALQLGNVSVEWNPAAGAPVVHRLLIHRDGAIIDVLKTAKFEVLRREDKLEQSVLNGRLTAVLRVPDLRVGDELEFAVTLRNADPTLGGANAGAWAVADTPMPGRYHFNLSWDKGQAPTLKVSDSLSDRVQRSADAIDIAIDNPATLTPPKDAPARYKWQRYIEYSDFKSWHDVGAVFVPLYARAATLSAASPLHEEAARIAQAHPDPMGRAAAALKLVQQQIRYIYVGMGNGNLVPAQADETWSRRYGDCKGKTALLLALLNELGIKAEPVLVNSAGLDDGLSQRLPSPDFFDHVLVRATIDGKRYWLDGTLPPVAGPSLDPVTDYRWVLPLGPTDMQLEQIAWHPYKQPQSITLNDIDARAGFDKPATITRTTITRGIKGLVEYVQFSALTPGQIETAFRNQLAGSTSWNTLDSVKWHYDAANDASILTLSGTGNPDWDKDDDGGWSLSLPGGGFSPPDRRAREAGQDQKAPYYNDPDYHCDVTTVRFPKATKDEEWSFNTLFDTVMYGQEYYRDAAQGSHTAHDPGLQNAEKGNLCRGGGSR